jgi:hypothetical protein
MNPGRFTSRERIGVERHKHRVQAWGGRLTGAAAGRSHGPLATASGFRTGMPRPWRVKACAATARSSQAGGDGVDATELFGELKGALGFGSVG